MTWSGRTRYAQRPGRLVTNGTAKGIDDKMVETVLFFDPFKAGHRLHSLVAYVRGLQTHPDIKVVFAVHEWVAERALDILDGNIPSNVTFHPLASEQEGIVSQTRRDILGSLRGIHLAESIANSHGARNIYFMHFDTFKIAVLIRIFQNSKFKYSGLIYKATYHYECLFKDKFTKAERLSSLINLYIIKTLLRSKNVCVLHSLDNHAPALISSSANTEKFVGVRDGLSPPLEMRVVEDVPDLWLKKANKFLIFGALSQRKGIFQLLDAITYMNGDEISSSGFLFCGKIDDTSRDQFESRVRRLKAENPSIVIAFIDNYLSDEELWWTLDKCTAVLAPYQRHVGSSGVLRWAAAAGKPILTQDFGLVGWESRTWKLGVVVDTSSPAVIAAGMKRFISGDIEALGDKKSQSNFALHHSEGGFANDILSTLSKNIAATSRKKKLKYEADLEH